jgi:hypothetical protein
VTSLEETLAERPDLTELRIALAQYFVFRSPGKALNLVESVKLGDQQSDEAEDIRALAQLMNLQGNGESPAAEKLQCRSGSLFRVGKMETGIQHLIDAVSLDKTYQGGPAQKGRHRRLQNTRPQPSTDEELPLEV